jgi:hypothetical protein
MTYGSKDQISAGEWNKRDIEYIPDRIHLGLSAYTLFAAIRRVQPVLGQLRYFKIEADFSPRWRHLLPSLPPAL